MADSELVGNLENYAEAQSKGKKLGGLAMSVASLFAGGKDLAIDILKTELGRIKKKASDEESERVRKLTADLLKQRILKQTDAKAQAELKALKDQQKKAELEHKKTMQGFKNQQQILDSQKKLVEKQLRNEQDAGKREALQANLDKINSDITESKKASNIADARYEHQTAKRNAQAGAIEDQLAREIQAQVDRANKSMGYTGDEQIKLDDVTDLKAQDLSSLATAYTVATNNLKTSALGGDDFSLGSLRSSLDRDKGSIGDFTRPSGGIDSNTIQALTTALTSALKSAPAQTSTQDKALENQEQNLRSEAQAHRAEREALTDRFRDQVTEHSDEVEHQLQTIVGNQKHLYELLSENGIQQGDSGGLASSFLDLFKFGGGAGGGSLLSKGLGLAKGALTKVAIPLALANGAYSGIKGGFDTEGIMRQKGLDDPSQVGITDRIHYGLSGMLSGITGGLIGTDTIANFTDRVGNFITGDGFVTKKEMKDSANAQARQDEADMDAILASRGIIRTSDGSYTQADNSIHAQILKGMGYESAPAPKGQELAPLNEGFGGSLNSNVSNVTNHNTTNVIPESPRFRINDQATLALATQGL